MKKRVALILLTMVIVVVGCLSFCGCDKETKIFGEIIGDVSVEKIIQYEIVQYDSENDKSNPGKVYVISKGDAGFNDALNAFTKINCTIENEQVISASSYSNGDIEATILCLTDGNAIIYGDGSAIYRYDTQTNERRLLKANFYCNETQYNDFCGKMSLSSNVEERNSLDGYWKDNISAVSPFTAFRSWFA
ncbi:MAG TPA: hypothetical protein VJZ69_02720 [Clostridia bacterium]|nr:hypothetical protein [Clostridia bacterium]